MKETSTSKVLINYMLVGVSAIVGLFAAILAVALKHLTEHFEARLFTRATDQPFYFFDFPFFALTMIWFLRRFAFRNKENKGITEVFKSIAPGGKPLPEYKIPSHFVNGFLTVAFGGSTGIEVLT